MTHEPTAHDLAKMQHDPREFRSRLLIDCDGQPRPLGEVVEPWQTDDFDALDSGWRRVAGHAGNAPRLRAYLERPRGHSKTQDLAVMAAWALLASRRPLAGVAAAADRDQARLLRDAMARLTHYNPWLRGVLDVQAYRAVNTHTGSALEILAADASSSYGLTPDFILADELTHWPASGEELWTSLASAAAKKPSCLLIVIANAGLGQGTSWQWRVREAARADHERWYFSRLDGPQARWITAETLAEQQRMLPPGAYARLWLNRWQTSTGDAIDPADVQASLTREGPLEADPHGLHFDLVGAGLDLALRRDRAGLVIVGVDVYRQRVAVLDAKSWAPARMGDTIDLRNVRDTIAQLPARYPMFGGVAYDPWQAALLAQDVRELGIPMFEMPSTAKNLDRMARSVLEVFRDRAMDLYEHAELLGDLHQLSVIERPTGFRLHAARNSSGHADLGFALALILPIAWENMSTYRAREAERLETLANN